MHDFGNRRRFLSQAGLVVTGLAVTGLAQQKQESSKEEDVSPAEDLMREHGLLNRVLLIYESCGRKIARKSGFDPALLNQAADIIKTFIEDYHEKLEEEHLFPRFEKAGKLTDLVATLRQQHQAGRSITQRILQASAGKMRGKGPQLITNMNTFIRMYRPHEAREDTVLFPALRSIVSSNEYDAMGEDFEKREHQLFGKEGFEGMVVKVGELEKKLGIYDLAKFTPAV